MNHYKFNRKLKRKLCKLGVLTKVMVNMSIEGDFGLDLRSSFFRDLLGLFSFGRSNEGAEFWREIDQTFRKLK